MIGERWKGLFTRGVPLERWIEFIKEMDVTDQLSRWDKVICIFDLSGKNWKCHPVLSILWIELQIRKEK